MGRHRILPYYVALSVVLLAAFLLIKQRAPSLLELELKWLIVAAAPVIIGLIADNYIKTFKGLGIEVESLLQNPIAATGLVVTDALESIPCLRKGSTQALQNMPPEEKAKYRRLTFVSPREPYYSEFDVGMYFMELPGLEYIEITDNEQRFRALVVVEPFRERFRTDAAFREQFVDAVHAGVSEKFFELFSSYYVTGSVSDGETLVSVAMQVRRSGHGLLAVVDSGRKLLGVITTGSVEKRITDEVLSSQQ